MLLEAAEQIKVVRSAGNMTNLLGEWSELWNVDPNATPFQNPIWLSLWNRHFGGEPYILLCRREDQLIGLLPLEIANHPLHQQAQFIGNGISDHLDALFLPGYETEASTVFWCELLDARNSWDQCVLQDLRASSPLFGHAPEQATRQGATPAPTLGLANCESIREAIPERQLKKLDYYRQRAAKAGATFEQASKDNFDALFSAFVRLHTRRWEMRGASGVLSDRKVREFHREAAWEFLNAGLLRLYGLCLGGDVIATFYGFSAHQTTFYYLGGFEPRYSSLSPGLLMIGHAIEEAIREGDVCFDFLRGDEPYKYQWGACDTPKYSLILAKQG
jgi:CelD/BcsL family acetyltransferase involved in cellulose biosynthesis